MSVARNVALRNLRMMGGIAVVIFAQLSVVGTMPPASRIAALLHVAASHTGACGNTVHALKAGYLPVALALATHVDRAFVRNSDGTINMFSPSNDALLRTISVEKGMSLHTPPLLVVSQRTGHVFAATSQGIIMLDAATGQILRTAIVTTPYPSAAAVDEQNGHIFVAAPHAITVLNAASGAIVHTVSVTGTPRAIAVDEDTGRVFATGGYGTSMLDATSGTLMRTIPVAGGTLAIDDRLKRVYIGLSNGNIATLDEAGGAVKPVIDLHRRYRSVAVLKVVVDQEDDHIAVAWETALEQQTFPADIIADRVSMLDAANGQVLYTVNQGPILDLVMDQRYRRLFITLDTLNASGSRISTGDVRILDSTNGHVRAAINVGSGPIALALDQHTQQTLVLNQGSAMNNFSGSLSLFNANIGGASMLSMPTPADPVTSVCNARYVPATGHNLSGAFLAFWTRYGGVDAFGYPRTEPFTEDGHLVQYTDRFLLQLVNGQVSTGPLGRLLTAQRSFAPTPPFTSTPGRLFFTSTQHSLSGPFLAWWQTHHGATLLGAPISEVITEGNGDGSERRYPLQWFENGRLEYHPEMAGTRYSIELGLVGLQALQRRGWLP